MYGWLEIASTTVTPLASCRGGLTAATPGTRFSSERTSATAVPPPPFTATRIGVSRKGGNSDRRTSSTCRALADVGRICASTEVNLIP
jgi:hypothetical protein